MKSLLFPLFLTVVLPTFASGMTLIHDETTDGDLSNDAASPTALTFVVGSNRIIGTVVASSDIRDFFTFEILSGQQLTRLDIVDYNDPDFQGMNDGNTGYIHIDDGSQTVIPTNGNAGGDVLGGNHLNPVIPGTNYLEILGGEDRLAGSGFTAPLGPGFYTIDIQQTGSEVSDYIVDFTVVPEPASILFLGFASLLGFLRRRR